MNFLIAFCLICIPTFALEPPRPVIPEDFVWQCGWCGNWNSEAYCSNPSCKK